MSFLVCILHQKLDIVRFLNFGTSMSLMVDNKSFVDRIDALYT